MGELWVRDEVQNNNNTSVGMMSHDESIMYECQMSVCENEVAILLTVIKYHGDQMSPH